MINLEQLGVHLPQGFLFQNVNLQINKGDKIGLVGKNGAGKSTLMRLLSGWDSPTDGKIHKPKDCTIGFLTQDIKIDTEQSVFDYLNDSNEVLTNLRTTIEQINSELVSRQDYESESYLSLLNELNELNHQFSLHEGFQWEERIVNTLKGLGFGDAELRRSLSTFSGGWKMRAELAKILVNRPDIISISWLENYLQKFEGAVIVISHDRLFLDNVTKRTLEISLGKILDYPYPYSKYKAFREEEIERLEGARKQQDKEIKHTEELINKFRAKKNKAAFAQSLIKKLEKTERIEVDNDQVARMKIAFPLSVQPGKWVLELQDMGKRFAEKLIFKNINITVGRGEKIALLGPNGVGKSTLLKRIMGALDGEGSVILGHNVQITYFAQDQAESLDPGKTVYETVDEIATGDARRELRSLLGAFLFSGEDIDKRVGVLSGGERTRLALCQLLLSPSNFLILDEPTNHLDIQSKDVLKQALLNYEGTFIVVSHDREFLEGLTNRIWDIEQKGLKIHHFGVQEFLKRKMNAEVGNQPEKKLTVQTNTGSAEPMNYEETKELKRKKNQLANQIKRFEDAISDIEGTLQQMNQQIAELDYSNEHESNEVLSRYDAIKKELDLLMLKWEEATEELMSLDQ